MTHEEIKKLEENTEKYKKALTLVYADGDVSNLERKRLISLKNELGLSDSLCMAMEAHFHETANLDEIKVDEIKKIYHCHLCDNDGGIKWRGINHSMLEYIEVGDTYIEASNGGSYTGLREPFVLSIGQSFEDLLDEYGEKHIYDAIEDGKLQVFDEQNDLETYLKLCFDILDFEDMERVYLKQLDNQNLADYIKTLERNGYDVSSLTEDMDFNHVTKIDLLQEYLNSDEKHNFEVLNTPFNPEKNMALVVWDNENHKLSEWNVDVLHQYLAERLLEDKGIVPVLRDEIIPDLIKSLEEGSRKKLIDNRIDLLNGKTELSQDELYQLVEFKQEYTSNDTLEVFTNKKYRELDNKEKKELVEKLLKSDYLKYKNCYISRSKLLYDSSETLEKEITILEKLNNLGYEVYLLPYAYARDSMNCYLKNADSITNGEFLEFKTVVSTGKNAGQSVYRDARKQADNVFISLKNELSEEKVINNIYATIKESKKYGQTNSFEGLVFLNFEQDNNRTVLYNFDKDGYAIRLENPSAEYLKKIKGIVSDSQVLENPMLEHGSSPKSNIQQPSPVVNSKMSDWEMKYSSLSAEKLISFISDEAFTKDMAQMVIVDFESNGSPLVIDELGNICDKNIWEAEETNAITAYMPSGITSKEIEIIEDFLTRHRDIPAEQRVEFLKLKDTFEEINERLVAKEERQTELERDESTSATRSEKDVVDDYISKVKENLLSSSKNAVEEVFESSKIALKNFSDDEKKIIGQYLFDNGATNETNLGKLLKQKIEPKQPEKKINHNIVIERSR